MPSPSSVTPKQHGPFLPSKPLSQAPAPQHGPFLPDRQTSTKPTANTNSYLTNFLAKQKVLNDQKPISPSANISRQEIKTSQALKSQGLPTINDAKSSSPMSEFLTGRVGNNIPSPTPAQSTPVQTSPVTGYLANQQARNSVTSPVAQGPTFGETAKRYGEAYLNEWVKPILTQGPTAPISEALEGAFTPNKQNRNYLEEAGANFRAGLGDVLETAGNTAHYLGDGRSQMVSGIGDSLRRGGDSLRQGYETEQVTDMNDPRFFSTTLARSMAFPAAAAPVAIGGALGGEAIAGAAGLGALGTYVAGSLGAAIPATAFESAMEAGDTYAQARERGETLEQSRAAANEALVKNAGLVGGTNLAEFLAAFAPVRGFNRVAATIGKAGAGAVVEGGQEGYQDVIQRDALGEDVSYNPMNWDQATWDAAKIGALIGGGMAGVGAVVDPYSDERIQTIQRDVVNALPPQIKKHVQDYTESRIKEGADQTTALNEVMDDLIQMPETQEIVQEVLQKHAKREAEKEKVAAQGTAKAALDLGVIDALDLNAGRTNKSTLDEEDLAARVIQAEQTFPDFHPSMTELQETLGLSPNEAFDVATQMIARRQERNRQAAAAPSMNQQEAGPIEFTANQAAPEVAPVDSIDIPSVTPVESQTGLDQLGSGMTSGITENMYDMLWNKVQKGDVKEAGQVSPLLQAAKFVRDAGGLQTRDDLIQFANDVASVRDQQLTGPAFQQAMGNVVNKYTPQQTAQEVIEQEPSLDELRQELQEENRLQQEIQVGDKVTIDGRKGEYEVVDVKDQAAVKVRFPNGQEIPVGRSKVQKLQQTAANEQNTAVPDQSVSSEGSDVTQAKNAVGGGLSGTRVEFASKRKFTPDEVANATENQVKDHIAWQAVGYAKDKIDEAIRNNDLATARKLFKEQAKNTGGGNDLALWNGAYPPGKTSITMRNGNKIDVSHDQLFKHYVEMVKESAGTIEQPREKTIDNSSNDKNDRESNEQQPDNIIVPDVGNRDSVIVEMNGKQEEVQVGYAIVDASNLVTSHNTDLTVNEEFPQEMQPRDRTREAYRDQITRIAQGLIPEYLGKSPKASEGAPIIGEDGVVESGNGRTIALKNAYQEGMESAKRYREWLQKEADIFGLTENQVNAYKHPVLVRVRLTDLDREEFARAANKSDVVTLSPSEQAQADAAKLSIGLMQYFSPDEKGQIQTRENREFITEFMRTVVGSAERNLYMTSEGALSQSGINRIRNAVFAKAYGDAAVIEKLAEDPDNNVRNITNALLLAAPRFAALKADMEAGVLIDADISQDLSNAVKVLSELREEGRSVQEYLDQGSMFGDDLSPIAKEWLSIFERFKGSAKRISTYLLTYAHNVQAVGDPSQMSLFGQEYPTKEELLEAAIREIERTDGNAREAAELQVTLFDEPKPYVEQDTESIGRSQKESAAGNQRGYETVDPAWKTESGYNRNYKQRIDYLDNLLAKNLKPSLKRMIQAEKDRVTAMWDAAQTMPMYEVFDLQNDSLNSGERFDYKIYEETLKTRRSNGEKYEARPIPEWIKNLSDEEVKKRADEYQANGSLSSDREGFLFYREWNDRRQNRVNEKKTAAAKEAAEKKAAYGTATAYTRDTFTYRGRERTRVVFNGNPTQSMIRPLKAMGFSETSGRDNTWDGPGHKMGMDKAFSKLDAEIRKEANRLAKEQRAKERAEKAAAKAQGTTPAAQAAVEPQTQEQPDQAPAAKEATEKASAVNPTIVDRYLMFEKRVQQGKVEDVEEIKRFYQALKENANTFKESLVAKLRTMDQYKKKRNATLADLANKTHERIAYTLASVDGMGISYNPSEDGAKERAVENKIVGLTQADLDKHNAEREKSRNYAEKVKNNPETLQELRDKKRQYGLTDQEQERLDELEAQATKERDKERKKQVAEVSGKIEFGPVESFTHTKTGAKMFKVALKSRLDKEAYTALNKRMKDQGHPGYSTFAKGFLFNADPTEYLKQYTESLEDAVETQGSQEDAEVVRRKKVADKLRTLADGMAARANEALSRDRLTNTAKRAREAAHAEEAAQGELTFSKIMRNVADGIESGEAVHLEGVSARTHLETLTYYLRMARNEYIRKNNISYSDSQKIDFDPEHIKGLDYPYPQLHKDTLRDLIKYAGDLKGGKMAARSLNGQMANAKTHLVDVRYQMDNIEKLLDLAKGVKDAKYTIERIEDSLIHNKRLQTMGIKTAEQFRSALREYLKFRDGTAMTAEQRKELELKQREREMAQLKVDGFFPTPKPLIDKMLDYARIEDGMTVLEPSAGKGNIADAIRKEHPNAVLDVVEYNHSLSSFLQDKGHNVVGDDFLEHTGQYDRIIMNPPFENLQDVDHVRHAYEQLKPGGRLVAIMSAGPFGRSDKKSTEFRQWLDDLGAEYTKNPSGSFKDSERSTGVETYMVVIDKDSAAMAQQETAAARQKDIDTFVGSKGTSGKPPAPQKIKAIQAQSFDTAPFTIDDVINGKAVVLSSEGPAPRTDKRVTRTEISQFIKDKLGVQLGVGHTKGVAPALYNRKSNVIRSQDYGDFEKMAHEIGHAYDRNGKYSKDPAFADELQALADRLEIPVGMDPEQIQREGFAEFMRTYLYSSEELLAVAPNLLDAFDQDLKAQGKLKDIRTLREMIQTWIGQSPDAHVRAGWQETTERKVPMRERWENFYTKIVDDMYPMISRVQRALGRNLDKVPDAFNPIGAIIRWRGSDGKAETFLEYGVVNNEGKKIGKGLTEILSKVDDLNVLNDLLVALRSVELSDVHGKTKTPVDIAKARRMITQLRDKKEGRQYFEAAKELYAYQRDLLNLLVESGRFSKEDIDRFTKDHNFYVPFYRVQSDTGLQAKVDGYFNTHKHKKMGGLQSPIRKMSETGSTKNVISPVESIVRNTYLYVSIAERNKVGVAFAKTAELFPEQMTPIFERVDTVATPGITFEQMQALFGDQNATEDASVELNEEAVRQGFLAMFTPTTGKNETIVYVDGEAQTFKIRDQSFYTAFQALVPETLNGLAKIVSPVTNVLRTGITMTPDFLMLSILRNAAVMALQSKSFNMIDWFTGRFPLEVMMGFYHALKKDSTYYEWKSTGAGNSTINYSTKHFLDIKAKKILKEQKAKGLWRKTVKGAESYKRLSDAINEMYKIAEYTRARKKGASNEEAAVRSRMVDYDHKRAGSWGRNINATSLFFNAGVQGLDMFFRSLKNKNTWGRGLVGIVVPTIILLAMNWDDEEYWELTQEERDRNYIIKIGDGQFLKIPIPFEYGLTFKTGIEYAAVRAFTEHPAEFEDYWKNWWQTATPSLMVSTMIPWIELWTGVDYETGRNIVPMDTQDMEPRYQYNDNTPEMYKLLGDWLNVSPAKIDHAIRSFTGGAAKYVSSIGDFSLEKAGVVEAKDKIGNTNPLISRFVGSVNDGTTASGNEFYEKLDKLEQQHSSYGVPGDPEPIVSNHRKAQKFMAALRNMRSDLLNEKGMSLEQKKANIEKINKALRDLPRKMLGKEALDEPNFLEMMELTDRYIKWKDKQKGKQPNNTGAAK
ncbi:LPD38 domain-containing protein [Brevibacillus migulae]|uniref:LPD38 domain-containing protein n=1 Tax=Brevibacillus migulae TaxID=1644114 RepID=UPI00106F07EA|nr:LPD38 domain-containing protein [Brevibacillus migulae]